MAKIRRLVGEEVEDELEEGDEGPRYPRGMLKLGLSDGYHPVVYVSTLVPVRLYLCVSRS